jgi:cytochrome b6-f complex iron-sulfur subunit
MERRTFVKQCGLVCFSLAGLSAFLSSCTSKHMLSPAEEGGEWIISKSNFVKEGKDTSKFKKYVLIKPNGENYPIVIYRFSDQQYRAFLLRCTHQGNELTVNGNIMSCPAHGSEFDTEGKVIQGPALQTLKTYSVRTDNENVYIKYA